jgi:hypothetical protein
MAKKTIIVDSWSGITDEINLLVKFIKTELPEFEFIMYQDLDSYKRTFDKATLQRASYIHQDIDDANLVIVIDLGYPQPDSRWFHDIVSQYAFKQQKHILVDVKGDRAYERVAIFEKQVVAKFYWGVNSEAGIDSIVKVINEKLYGTSIVTTRLPNLSTNPAHNPEHISITNINSSITSINRYEIVREIAKGGMGAIYEAVDERLDLTVALKQQSLSDPSAQRAFEREAKLLAKLRDPAIPRVTDYFHKDNSWWLVMDYIESEDFFERIKGGKISFKLWQRTADELSEALMYLHTRNPPIVHMDIKPHNIKQAPAGQIMLLDFGIARVALQTLRIDTLRAVTREYAPLELLSSSTTKVDGRYDQFMLAATLYHILTGQFPVDSQTRSAHIHSHKVDPLIPPSKVRGPAAGVTHPVADIGASMANIDFAIMRAMSLLPEKRFKTIYEFRAALLR